MLTLREQRNFQFDFLRPQHSLFQYFTKLLEQYTNLEDQDHGGGWDATGEAEIAAPASAEGAWREEEIGCVEQFWVLGTIVVTIPIVKFLCWE